MKKEKSFYFNLFCESFDLALITLRSFDLFTYICFFEELEKSDNSLDLILTVHKLRLQNQINLTSEKKQLNKFLKNETISYSQIKKILIIFSKILNNKFFKDRLDTICFYLLPEYGIFTTKLKILQIQKIVYFNIIIFHFKKRFNFFYQRLITKFYIKELYPIVLNISYQNGLRYLKFFANL